MTGEPNTTPEARAAVIGLDCFFMDTLPPVVLWRMNASERRSMRKAARAARKVARAIAREARTLARTEARQTGRRILVWGPGEGGSVPGRPKVQRAVIALGAKHPKPRHPGGTPTPVEAERDKRWQPRLDAPVLIGGRADSAGTRKALRAVLDMADLPDAPRVRCPTNRRTRAELRAVAEHPVIRRRTKGGRAALVALGQVAYQDRSRAERLAA